MLGKDTERRRTVGFACGGCVRIRKTHRVSIGTQPNPNRTRTCFTLSLSPKIAPDHTILPLTAGSCAESGEIEERDAGASETPEEVSAAEDAERGATPGR
jgi:hypothetical protein